MVNSTFLHKTSLNAVPIHTAQFTTVNKEQRLFSNLPLQVLNGYSKSQEPLPITVWYMNVQYYIVLYINVQNYILHILL